MQWDAQGKLQPYRRRAMTNAERQREFRARNPDYYRLLQARRRAAIKARVAEAKRLEREAAAAAAAAAARRQAVQAMIARPEPLMLPAPAVTIEIPGMTIPAINAIRADAIRADAIRAIHASPSPAPAPVSQQAVRCHPDPAQRPPVTSA